MKTIPAAIKKSVVAMGIVATLTISSVTNVVAGLPNPGMKVDAKHTALVITDPQNDFLSPDGVTWGVVGKSVTANKTVEHIEALLKAAKGSDMPVFISPHYYYPTDHGWQTEGALEVLMHKIGMFDRKDALSMEGFENSGADWLSKSHTLRMERQSSPARTNCTARIATTWYCNCENAASVKSSWPACRRTCVPNHTCVN